MSWSNGPDSFISGSKCWRRMSRSCAVSGEGPAIKAVRAKNYVVHVQFFRNPVESGARRMKCDRDTQAVVSADSIFARQHKQRGGIQALLQQFRKGVADPLDARSLGLIFKRNYQHGLTAVAGPWATAAVDKRKEGLR